MWHCSIEDGLIGQCCTGVEDEFTGVSLANGSISRCDVGVIRIFICALLDVNRILEPHSDHMMCLPPDEVQT